MNSDSQAITPTVLIVDDNPNNIKIIALVLRSLSYNLVVATNGQQAIEMVDRTKPDLILLDIMMPQMDGYEACKIIKAKPECENVPVIFITALNESESLVRAFEVGGIDYITKPFNKDELISRVKTHLELKLTRDRLEKTSSNLRELNALKDKLFSVIGHDLRSPLGSIKFSLEMLSAGAIEAGSEIFNDTLGALVKSTDEVFSLLENLLGWAKSQSGNLFIIPENFVVKDMVNSIYLLNKGNINIKKIEFKNNIADETKVFADLNTIKTVVRNLISNAIKFTPENGTIELSTEQKDDKLIIKIRDSGVGIKEENIPKLFNSSEHLSTYGTNREPGSGLGLVLCHDFVIKNEGQIWVESELGVGTTFLVELAAEKKEEQA